MNYAILHETLSPIGNIGYLCTAEALIFTVNCCGEIGCGAKTAARLGYLAVLNDRSLGTFRTVC